MTRARAVGAVVGVGEDRGGRVAQSMGRARGEAAACAGLAGVGVRVDGPVDGGGGAGGADGLLGLREY